MGVLGSAADRKSDSNSSCLMAMNSFPRPIRERGMSLGRPSYIVICNFTGEFLDC